ncbi:MAG: BrnT family toxin [Alphaproteobacteria bacterium]|nr:BrnT family toxin [Alphaproteobacteria bacterium]
MEAFPQVEGFERDEGNARKNEDKHGVSQAEAEQVFLNAPILLLKDELHSGMEDRFHALGRTDEGRFLYVTFTLRQAGARIRVISARNMYRKERSRYAEEV